MGDARRLARERDECRRHPYFAGWDAGRFPGDADALAGIEDAQAFLNWVFSHVPSYRNAKVLSVTNLPNQRLSYQVWQFIEARVSFTDNGLPVTGVFKVGTANYYGMNDAMIVGYRAANPIFAQAQSFMPQIAKSIVLTNAAEASGNNTLIRPKNNPLDNSGLIQAGKNRDRVREHASEGWREGMMGTEPTIDPKTGRQYNTPLGNYNGARGGYVNPERPNELSGPVPQIRQPTRRRRRSCYVAALRPLP